MKKNTIPIILFILILLLSPSLTNAANVVLSWDPNFEPDLGGYKIYYGTSSQDYTTTIDVEYDTSYTITGLDYETYYFTLTAYDIYGNESDFSEEVSANPISGNSPFILEAESMSVKTTGGNTSGGWNIWSNGYIAEDIYFDDRSSEYAFTVRAKGSYAGGAWPRMEVLIDGWVIGSVTVNSSSYFYYTINSSVSAGIHQVAIAFVNDYYQPPEDRNLYVDKLTISEVDED